ncbi:hypothetical protein K6V78_10245 [Streptococcus gallolyticus]|nr:hypothetical protein [Streptococcus gallolyticus]MBY5041944.1 hypothetical protein [Streptococcus gallolyticus]
MKKCIFIRGNSASGKTTLAKLICEQVACQSFPISQDVVRREMLGCKDGPETLALPILQEFLVLGHEQFDLVIVEGILRSDWYAPLFQQAQELYKEDLIAYYFDLSFEETLAQHQTKPQAAEYGEESLRSWWLNKDLSPFLEEKRISSVVDLNELASEIAFDL